MSLSKILKELSMVKLNMIEEVYKEAIKVLKKNITKNGFTASSEHIDNYNAVWARDHSICSLAAIMTNDRELIKCGKRGLLFLLSKQIENGQVPSYVETLSKKKIYGGLGSITTIDSNMWVIILCAIYFFKTKDKSFISQLNFERYKRFYRLLKAFDSNDCGLMEVHIASDWADILNRTYHVLYDQCLYYEALRALEYLMQSYVDNVADDNQDLSYNKKRIKYIFKRRIKAKRRINSVLWFDKSNIEKIKEEYMIYHDIPIQDYSFYQTHIMPFKHEWSQRFDTFGNILAILTGISNKNKNKKIISYVFNGKINQPYPIKALDPPIFKTDKDWENIYALKDKPFTYHNAGIWPMLSGFWINTLIKEKRHKKALEELEKLAELIKNNHCVFNEYFHGKEATPMGTPFQAWSASGYIMAYQSVKKQQKIFSF